MTQKAQQFYEFGSFRIDAAKRQLLREGDAVPLTPKCFDMLLALVEESGRVVEKRALMTRVWPDSFVEEGNLSYNISMLRKALGERAGEHQYIVTIPGRGYKFVATVNGARDGNGDATSEGQVRSALPIEGEGKPDANDEATAVQASEKSSDDAKRLLKGWQVLVLITSLIAMTGIGYGLYRLINQRKPMSPPQPLISRLSFSGNVTSAAISPDGKFVGQVIDEHGKQSLLVKQVATTSYQEVVPPARVQYLGLTFSQDGDYIYYVRTEETNAWAGVLYKVPVLGGTPIRLLVDVTSPVTFSPDGQRFAFVRVTERDGETTLMVANQDGSGEQKLAIRKAPGYFSNDGPAWSPDGRTIACADEGGVVEVEVEGGIERRIFSDRWDGIGQLAWLSDGTGLLMTARAQESTVFQIWHLSYPGGVARRVTYDVNNYHNIGLPSDSSAVVTMRTDRKSSIWTQPYQDMGGARQITFSNYCGGGGISWAPDGKIVYRSIDVDGNGAIWVMDPDGRNERQLTFGTSPSYGPSVTPEGRYIVFVSTRFGKTNLWRMDIDGGNPIQLTYGSDAGYPHCSPDGKWVVYQSEDTGKLTLWKVSIDGGDPVRLTEYASAWPMFSPDGTLVTCACWDERVSPQRWRIAVIPSGGGQPSKLFDPAPTGSMLAPARWTADGRALTYVGSRDGVCNIWSQPLEGGPPKQLTDFKEDQIFCFDWSRDGKWLACSRGVENSDVVRISNFR